MKYIISVADTATTYKSQEEQYKFYWTESKANYYWFHDEPTVTLFNAVFKAFKMLLLKQLTFAKYELIAEPKSYEPEKLTAGVTWKWKKTHSDLSD